MILRKHNHQQIAADVCVHARTLSFCCLSNRSHGNSVCQFSRKFILSLNIGNEIYMFVCEWCIMSLNVECWWGADVLNPTISWKAINFTLKLKWICWRLEYEILDAMRKLNFRSQTWREWVNRFNWNFSLDIHNSSVYRLSLDEN